MTRSKLSATIVSLHPEDMARTASRATSSETKNSGVKVELRLLGESEIRVGDACVLTPIADRQFSALVLIALSPGMRFSRAELVEYLWPSLDDRSARHCLRQLLYKLRAVGFDLRATTSSVALNPDQFAPCFILDGDASLLSNSLRLGGIGYLAPDWNPKTRQLQKWLEDKRDETATQLRNGLLPKLKELHSGKQWKELQRGCEVFLALDPNNVDAICYSADALAQIGNSANALIVIEEALREVSAEEVDATKRLQRARRSIRNAADVSYAVAATAPLIGRAAQLAAVEEFLDRAQTQGPVLVKVSGSGGSGKSALSAEIVRKAALRSFSTCVVRMNAIGLRQPYGLVNRLCTQLLLMPGSLGCSPDALAALRQLAPDLNQRPLNLPTPPILQRPLSQHLSELFEAISEEAPLLVLVDDAHESDTVSVALLDAAISQLDESRVAIVQTVLDHAPCIAVEFLADSNFVLGLPPLDNEDAARLARSILREPAGTYSEADVFKVTKAAEGIPQRIIASARAVRRSSFTGERSPEPTEMTQRFVKSLEPEERRYLASIALLGGRASIHEIREAIQEPLGIAMDTIRTLQTYGVIDVESDDVLACSAEVAIASQDALPIRERLVLMKSLAEMLLRRLSLVFQTQRALLALDLALESRDTHLYVSAVLSLCDKLIVTGVARAALRHLEIARSAPTTPEVGSQIHKALVEAAHSACAYDVIATHRTATDAADDASSEGEAVSTSLVEIEVAIAHTTGLEMRPLAAKALSLANRTELPVAQRLKASRIVIAAAADLIQPDLAISAYEIARQLTDLESAQETDPIFIDLQYHTIFGDLERAHRLALRLLKQDATSEHSAQRAQVISRAGYVLRVAGDQSSARDAFNLLWRIGERDGVALFTGYAAWQLSLMGLDEGNLSAAIEWNSVLQRCCRREPMVDGTVDARSHALRIQVASEGHHADLDHPMAGVSGERGLTPRGRMYAFALALCAKPLLDSQRDFRRVVAEATELLLTNGRYGGQDFLAISLVKALGTIGDSVTQSRVINQYFRLDRRERTSISAEAKRLDSGTLMLCQDSFQQRSAYIER